MQEHIAVGREYPTVDNHTTYSFGLDDQEFVVAFDTNDAGAFLDLVQRLRTTEASAWTKRDTPSFTCINTSVERAFDRARRPGAARPGDFARARPLRRRICRQRGRRVAQPAGPPGGPEVIGRVGPGEAGVGEADGVGPVLPERVLERRIDARIVGPPA